MEKARPLIILTVVVAVLVAALAIVDSVVRDQAENQVADRVQTALNLHDKPDVTLHGWPFIVNALTRSFPKAEVKASDVTATVGGRETTISDLSIIATGIEPDGETYNLKHVEARGTVSFESLTRYAGESKVSGRDNGRIAITYSADILGQKLEAVVTGVPTLNVGRQEVTLTDTAVEVAGIELTDELSQRLIAAVTKPVSVRQSSITVQSIEVLANGVYITATADDYKVSG